MPDERLEAEQAREAAVTPDTPHSLETQGPGGATPRGGRGSHATAIAAAAGDVAPGGDTAAIATVAGALSGSDVAARVLESACDAMLADGHGVARYEAMVAFAARSGDASVMGGIARSSASLARCSRRRERELQMLHERFAEWASRMAAVEGLEEVAAIAAEGFAQLTGLACGALYAAGTEHARMPIVAAVAADGVRDGAGAPRAVRIDRGIFADVIAGDRPLAYSARVPLDDDAWGEAGARSLIAVPMRDGVGRPLALLVAHDGEQHTVSTLALEAGVRLAAVAAGELAAATERRRGQVALATLASLAAVAHDEADDVAAQLEALAHVAIEATGSDSAVIRVRDAAGCYLETRAVASVHGDAVADIIGTRTRLADNVDIVGREHEESTGGFELNPAQRAAAAARRTRRRALARLRQARPDQALAAMPGGQALPLDPVELGLGEHEIVGIEEPPATWSPAGRRILRELSARSVMSMPVDSRYGRRAVLHVVRTTSRSFDELDRTCLRIVTAHAQHVVDRHVSKQQTARALDAARSAVRLLGEALIAGVRTERTLRFVPRLYHEMFASRGVRVWRRERDLTLTLVAGAGVIDGPGATPALRRSLERPLRLELDTTSTPHVAAVSIEGYGGVRVGVEFQLAAERSFGVEEQRLAVDVAARIQEAMWSAGQAAAQQRQLEQVRALQEVVAAAHAQLSERHVVATLLERVPELLGANAAAVFVVDADGQLAARGSQGMPASVMDAVERTRGWIAESAGDDRAAVLLVERAGHDERIAAPVREALMRAGLEDHGAIAVPLTGREQTLGLLVLAYSRGLPPSLVEAGEDLGGSDGSLRMFGRHAGSALINARTLERERAARTRTENMLETERENNRQVRALHEVSRTFATSLSFDETLRAVVEAMAERLDVDAVWIRTRTDRGDATELRAFHAGYPELAGALERMVAPPVPLEDPITAEVLGSRRAVLVEDADDHRWDHSETLARLRPFLQRGSTLAVLPVVRPGSASEDVIGTLVLLSIDPAHALTYAKVDVAASVTGQAALALDNARLYQQQKSFTEIIQESLLPRRLPDIHGIEYGVLYRSAAIGGTTQIGGDFYDFLELEDGRLAMALGDVTGKGVQAAADTAMTKYVFRSLAREHPSPESFLRHANEVVCDEITSGKFVTLFYCVIDPVARTIECGNAGHPEPKLLHQPGSIGTDGTVVEGEPRLESIGMEGLAMGILQDQDYERRTYAFPPGSALVVYTDGVVEARREGRLYGQYRLERRIMEESGGGAGQIAYSIYEDCHAYAENGLNDDVAIVVVRHLPELEGGIEGGTEGAPGEVAYARGGAPDTTGLAAATDD